MLWFCVYWECGVCTMVCGIACRLEASPLASSFGRSPGSSSSGSSASSSASLFGYEGPPTPFRAEQQRHATGQTGPHSRPRPPRNRCVEHRPPWRVACTAIRRAARGLFPHRGRKPAGLAGPGCMIVPVVRCPRLYGRSRAPRLEEGGRRAFFFARARGPINLAAPDHLRVP